MQLDVLGSVALLSYFDKVWALLKCEIEVNPVALGIIYEYQDTSNLDMTSFFK